MRRALVFIAALFAPGLGLATPLEIPPNCTEFGGTETGFLCNWTHRISMNWVCTQMGGYTTAQCDGAYTDCTMKLIWSPGYQDMDDFDTTMSCTTVVLGT